MPEVRIKVGASVDNSVKVVFRPLVLAAKEARKKIDKEFKDSAKTVGSAFRDVAKESEKANERVRRGTERTSRRMPREFDRSFREMKRGFRELGKVAEAEMRRAERAGRRAGESFARRTSFAASRFLTPRTPVAGIARRAGVDVLRGAGVETNLAGIVGSIADEEELAARVSIKAFRPGEQGFAGKRFDPGELTRRARSLGRDLAIDPSDALRGLFAFVSQSGDLEAGLSLWRDIAVLSKSQSVNIEDAFFAAGKVNSALGRQKDQFGDVEMRTKAVREGMNVIVGSTKQGSIEMAKLTKEIPKITGLAPLFGDPKRALADLTALIQIAEKGQAKNAAVAATQVQNLQLAFSQPNRLRRLAGTFGIGQEQLRTETGALKPFRGILQTLLGAAQGKETEVTRVLRNKREFLPLIDLIGIFRGAGGTKNLAKGMQAITEEFDRLSKPIEEAQVIGDLNEQLKTTRSEAARFNVEMRDVVDASLPRLVSAFKEIAPAALALAEVLGDVATFVVENPKTAIAGAISMSIARAGIESTLRAGLERLIIGTGGPGGRSAGVGRAVGVAGAGLTIAATAVTIAAVGTLVISKVGSQIEEGRKTGDVRDIEAFNVLSRLIAARRAGTVTPELVKEAEVAKAQVAKDIERAKGFQPGVLTLEDIGNVLFGNAEQIGLARRSAENLEELQGRFANFERLLANIQNGVLKVEVQNPGDQPPEVDEEPRVEQ